MVLKDISFDLPEENVLFDEVLLQMAEDGRAGEALRFWESPVYFVVLGRIGRVEEEIKKVSVNADRIPVLRRSSGGGTVLQGPGCLNYTLVLSKNGSPTIADLKRSYHYILGKVVHALSSTGQETVYLPISDIALKDSLKKISGNAQKRGRHFIMHHGTVLYDFDLGLIERYLTMPRLMPDYRNQRGHLEFVENIVLKREQIRKCLASEFNIDRKFRQIDPAEEQYLQKFVGMQKTVLKFS